MINKIRLLYSSKGENPLKTRLKIFFNYLLNKYLKPKSKQEKIGGNLSQKAQQPQKAKQKLVEITVLLELLKEDEHYYSKKEIEKLLEDY